jgi:anti-sigma factor RsiW
LNVRQPEFDINDETWVEERIEAYVDNQLTPDEKVLFERVLIQGPGCEEVEVAYRIRNGLRNLPAPSCPPHITEAVLLHARREAKRPSLWWTEPDVWHRWWDGALKPAMAMGMLALLVISAALIERPRQEAAITSSEVQQALAEAKWALGLVSRTGVQTGSSVRDNVVQPIRQALESAPDAAAELNRN